MAPKNSGRTKRAAGLSQPTLAFQHRKPSLHDIKPSLSKSLSSQSIPSPAPGLSTIPLPYPVPIAQIQPNPRISGKEDATKQAPRKQLDTKGKEWNEVYKNARVAMGGMEPIHAGPETHDHVLRVFDMSAKYGPSVGISRLQRWERAKKWGLNPPPEIHSILTTEQGEDDPSYRENVLHTWLG